MNLNNNHSFNIELAQLVGVEKALLLGRVWLYIDYHKRNGTNLRDDKFWMYDSSTALAEVYPYMTPQSIRRRMAELEKDGWLISGNYNRKSNDLTKWYALGATFISWIKNENLPAQNEQAKNNNEILEEIKPAQNERLHNQAEIFPAQIEQTPAQNEQSIAQNEQPLPIISYCNPVVAEEEAATPTINQEGKDLEQWIKLRYRHWFSKVDPHFQADVAAVHKAILATYTQAITQVEVLAIVDRAFERVVQEKPKKDWLTREVLLRVKWMLEDFFKDKEKKVAKEKTEAIKNLKPGDAGLWNPNEDPVMQELLNKKMFDKQEPKDGGLDKNSPEYKRRLSLFNQAVSEGGQ